MTIVHPEPTAATAKELYANAYSCGRPDCHRPLYAVDPTSSVRTLNSRIAHICARSEGGPRWDATMSAEDNRSVDNLLVLCLEHAVEIDTKAGELTYPPDELHRWKALQLEEFDALQQGWTLRDADYPAALHIEQGSNAIAIVNSSVSLGGQAGTAPGAGGGGGGAIGPGAIAGDGGAGGEIAYGVFRIADLPDSIEVIVGQGGEGGTDGGPGSDGGDTSFGDLLTARGGRGGGRATSAEPVPTSKERISVSTVVFADHCQVRDRLLFLVAGGWDHYDVGKTEGLFLGSLAVIMDVAPGPSGTIPVCVSIHDPTGASRWEATASVTVASSTTIARVPLTTPFQIEGHPLGEWTARMAAAGTEMVSRSITILGPALEPTP